MENQLVRTSKYLSKILRHDPTIVGIALEKGGWVSIDLLLIKAKISREAFYLVVQNNDKKRFEISQDGLRVRAAQGHSVVVDLGYEAAVPPEFLYHGTNQNVLEVILRDGLSKRKRHAVHLSTSLDTATSVGARRGTPVLLRIQALAMHEAGHTFQVSTNGVWLTDHVPPKYLSQTD